MPKARRPFSSQRTYSANNKRAKKIKETINLNKELLKIENDFEKSKPKSKIEVLSNILIKSPDNAEAGSSRNDIGSLPNNLPGNLIDFEHVWKQNVKIAVDANKSNEDSDSEIDWANAWESDEEEFLNIMNEKLIIENVKLEPKITGNRIVEINQILQRTIFIAESHARSCTAGNLFIEKEQRNGLTSIITYKCNLCDKTFSVSTENTKTPVINTASVWGTISTGSTFTHTQELFSVLNIPSMSNTLFYKIQDDLRNVWCDSSINSMEEAGKEERRLAIENDQLDHDGTPWTCVYLDGGWSKRSYGHNYNAASGVGVIVGQLSKKVLYMGVRNKFCIICTKADTKGTKPSKHICFKNWEGSSCAMEADIIVQGFCQSIEQHGLRYKKFIADGDSSVFVKIQENVPYGKQVSKMECTNHIIKNYGKRLHQLTKQTMSVSLAARKLLSTKKIKDLQSIAQKAIYDNAHGDIASLVEDLGNGPLHIYGHHGECKDYYCSNVGEVTPEIVSARSTGLLRLVQGALNIVIRKAHTLIDNETNNRAELFMNILARFTMGKRLNITQRSSYNVRADLSAMRYNKSFEWHASPWKRCTNQSPGKYFKKFMTEQKKYRARSRHYKRVKNHSVAKKINFDYGKKAIQPAMSDELVEAECIRLLKSLEVTKDRQLEIAETTVGQFDNPVYKSERELRLTASNFGLVIKRRERTSCHSLVKTILNNKSFTNEYTEYGKVNESVALIKLEEVRGIKVIPCGLFVDINQPYLGASPDGLIDNDKLVEVKCLPKIAKLNISLEKAAQDYNICLEFKNNKLSLKKEHVYYFQIQGQLHITERNLCYFVVFVKDSLDIFVEEIKRDDNFWKNRMEQKLERFYKKCVLPEIVRGNIKRGLKCVDPDYILDAQKNHETELKINKKNSLTLSS